MSFDSKSYIKKVQETAAAEPNQSFSPEAYKRALKAAEVPEVGAGETGLMSAVSTIPLGTLVKNLGTTAVLRLLNPGQGERAVMPAQAQMEWATVPEEEKAKLQADFPDVADPRGLLDTYRAVRDEDRKRLDAGTAQNPNAARAGTAAGLALSVAAPLPAVSLAGRGAATAAQGATAAQRLRALSAGRRVASAAATGSAYGALNGATDGEADLTRGDISGVLKDTAEGAAKGAVWGVGGGLLGEGASAALPRLLRYLKIRNTKEAIQGGSDIGAATRKPLRDESAELMIDDGMVPPGRNPSEIAARIVPAADAEGARLGRIIQGLESSGYTGPNAESVARNLEAQARRLSPNLSSDKSPAKILADEGANIRTVPRPTVPGSMFRPGGMQSPNLGLSQAEAIKSSIQGRAPYAKIESSERGDALKRAARTVRLSTEYDLLEQAARRDQDALRAFQGMGMSAEEIASLGAGSTGAQRVRQFLDQKGRLGKYLDAAQFSKRGGSKYDQRPRVGLLDTIEAQKAGNVVGAKLLARALAEVRGRYASTAANVYRDGQRFFSSPESSAAFGRAGSDAGQQAEVEAERWADSQPPENDSKLSPLARALVQALRNKRSNDAP